MAAPAAAAARFDAQQRAVMLLTSFAMAIERDDDIDDEVGEIFFDVLTELRTTYNKAVDCVDRQVAWEAIEGTIVALLGIAHALIEHLATDATMYEVIEVIAQAHGCGREQM